MKLNDLQPFSFIPPRIQANSPQPYLETELSRLSVSSTLSTIPDGVTSLFERTVKERDDSANDSDSDSKNDHERTSKPKGPSLNLDYGVRLQGEVAKAWEFQVAAQQGLAQFVASGDAVTIRRDAVISTPKGKVEVDAILETPTTDYLFEIKHSARPHVFLNLASQLRRAVDAYKGYLRREGVAKRVIPVAVVPASIAGASTVKNGFLVLRYHAETGTFVNLDEFKRMASQFETAL